MATQEFKLGLPKVRAVAAKKVAGGPSGIPGMIADDIWREHLEYRQILLNGEIDPEVIERVVMPIEKYNFEDNEREAMEVGYDRVANPITLYINSPGGVVSAGMAIVSAIEQSATPIITVAMGEAASMAFIILCAGHARYAYRHAELMYHQLLNGTIDSLEGHKQNVAQMERLQSRLDDVILRRTLITKKMISDVKERKKDWWLDADEAKALGVIDEVIPQALVIPRPKRTKK